jgi:ECF sigma factor
MDSTRQPMSCRDNEGSEPYNPVIMNDVSRILEQIQQGEPSAAARLLPLVYDELRHLAAAQLACEKPGQTLNATALVHEAYLRLVGDQQFADRRHFFRVAADLD